MADKSINQLPVSDGLTDDGLLVVYQDGATYSIKGELIKGFVEDSASGILDQANTSANRAQTSEKNASEWSHIAAYQAKIAQYGQSEGTTFSVTVTGSSSKTLPLDPAMEYGREYRIVLKGDSTSDDIVFLFTGSREFPSTPGRVVVYENQIVVKPYGISEFFEVNLEAEDNSTFPELPAKAVLYTEQTLTESQKAQARENIGAKADAPSYVYEEADRVAAMLLDLQTGNTITLGVISDVHINYGDERYSTNTQKAAYHAAVAMKRVGSQVGIDAMVNLGDNLWGTNTDVANAKQEQLILNRLIYDGFCNHDNFRLIGNHDANLWDACIPTTQIYAMNGFYNTYDDCGETRIRGYGFKDYEDRKIRVISMNTSDYIDQKGGYFLSDEQKLWFMGALDLSAKEDASEWSILLLSHFPLDYESDNPDGTGAGVMAILIAYVNGTSVSNTAGTYDYASKNKARIIANIHGHIHNFSYGVMDGCNIMRVSTPNTCFYNNGCSESGSDVYLPNDFINKIEGTKDDTTVTFYVIDTDTKTIHSINYGAGYDRQIVHERFKYVVPDLDCAERSSFDMSGMSFSSNNTRMALMCTTPNDGGAYVDRGNQTLYPIPVPEQATKVTISFAETATPATIGVIVLCFTLVDGVPTSKFKSEWSDSAPGNFAEISANKFVYEFAGKCNYMVVECKSDNSASITYPWDYDAHSNVTIMFE